MVKIRFNSNIYKIADSLVKFGLENLIIGKSYPKNHAKHKLGIITLLKAGNTYPEHVDAPGFINKLTFLNSVGGIIINQTIDIQGIKGLTVEFDSMMLHKPYTDLQDRWALLQRYEKSTSTKDLFS